MFVQIKLVVFTLGTVGIAWASRFSLRDYRSHGFYRTFAWVAILALLLVNIDFWFAQPFSSKQLLSWALLLASIFLVVPGFRLLRISGRPSEEREDAALVGMEKTTALVTTGIYGYIRHPLYSSLLFLTWGIFFKHPSWVGVILAALATFFLTVTARVEERENIAYFGQAYRDYREKTKMFVPFLF